MKAFLSLVKMQLAERLNITFKKENLKSNLLKMSLYLLLIAGSTALIFVIFYLFSMLGIFGIGGYIPVSLFNSLFYLILIIETLSCISRFTDSLFFSKDNTFLLTYPVGSNVVFLSKITVFYILELIRKEKKQDSTILIINKLDIKRKESETEMALSDYYSLGLSSVIWISAKKERNLNTIENQINSF